MNANRERIKVACKEMRNFLMADADIAAGRCSITFKRSPNNQAHNSKYLQAIVRPKGVTHGPDMRIAAIGIEMEGGL